jgi:diguanylate cyclase
MKVEIRFLRSAIARRVFWVLLAAAALPLAVFAALAYGTLSDQVEAGVRGRLQEAAKYAGLRVYDRLVAAQTALATMAAGKAQPDGRNPAPLAARALFVAVSTVEPATGRHSGSAELVDTWRVLHSDKYGAAATDLISGRHLWWTQAHGQTPARVLLGVRDGGRWWIGEVSPNFLWDELGDRDAVVSTCVRDARGRLLLCPQGAEPSNTVADAENGGRTASWSLFARADFGTIDWVFQRRAARNQLLAGDVPVEQVAWKAAAFSLLLVACLSLVLIRRTTVPLERLIDGTRRLAAREWSARVQVGGSDEFGQLAGSFNDMAGRIERQMQALQVQSGIDREILTGLDLTRVLAQVTARLETLLPRARLALLLAPTDGGRWQRTATATLPAQALAVDPALPIQALAGGGILTGAAAGVALTLLPPAAAGPGVGGAEAVLHLFPARANGETRAMLLLAADESVDDDTRRELQDLCDRLAVMLVASEREQQLRERAVHDSLTGLLNRAGLIEALDRRAGQTEGEGFVLAFIDLDGFKAVNDSRGHPVGDALLCRVAELLRESAPPGTSLARPGGDEFVLLLPADPDAAAALAHSLCERLGEPFVVAGYTLRVGASIGLARYPEHGQEHIELMRRADLALYAAKAEGRGRLAWFDPVMDARAAERAWLQAELPGALARNELCLYYQPRMRAGTGELASVEALVRWPHQVRGLIPPVAFVPLAEEIGLIEALGHWVLAAACRQMQVWRRAGVPVPRVAVNVSALQLAAPGFADEVLALVRQHALQPTDIELEITESLFAGDADEVALRLGPLRAVGMLVALDDFGTGFSSLSSLYRLPVDVLKIDRSFVIDLGERESADAVARTIVALARALGKHVVAEGVETEAQLQHLMALGCDELQGYLFARPLPAAELPDWIEQRSTALVH